MLPSTEWEGVGYFIVMRNQRAFFRLCVRDLQLGIIFSDCTSTVGEYVSFHLTFKEI